jgi:4-amino-4-deoxy-L-arabinose transferase-like glycosyltransferase
VRNISERARILIALLVLVIAFALPRGLALDRLVTPDEVTWLMASSNFYMALRHGDFAHTYQLEHPGVTTMWAGAAGFASRFPEYKTEAAGPMVLGEEDPGPILQSLGHEPLELIVAGRTFMLLGIVMILAAAFLCAVSLSGFWPSTIGFLLIAFDPFHIAHSRLLHQDGIASSLTLLTLLAFLTYLYRGQQIRYLFVSGIAAGLAWLTKSPMLFLIPFMALLVLIELIRMQRSSHRLEWVSLRWAAQTLIIWGAAGFAVFVLFWPAMWVDPIFTLRRIVGGMFSYAVTGHTEAPLFFNGRIYTGDPGASFYPITYFWRTTPVVLLGVVITGIGLIIHRSKFIESAQRRPLGMLFLFAALFTIFMTLGAKKFDRYLLPVYPSLDLVAGIGLVSAANWLRQHWAQPGLARASAPALLSVAILAQAASMISSFPYYLSYYNPVLGGTTQASKVMMIGWGEGLDQAARFLKDNSSLDRPRVMLGFWTGTFSYFYDGPIQWSDFAPGATTVNDWKNSDYCIIYINQWQRGRLPQELIDYLAQKEPAFVVRLQGLDYAYVYNLNNIDPPSYLFTAQQGTTNSDSSLP